MTKLNVKLTGDSETLYFELRAKGLSDANIIAKAFWLLNKAKEKKLGLKDGKLYKELTL